LTGVWGIVVKDIFPVDSRAPGCLEERSARRLQKLIYDKMDRTRDKGGALYLLIG
jgi:hypothetical protein